MGKESARLLWAKIVVALLLTLAVSFAVAGYQAILPVLLDVGAYNDRCDGSETMIASDGTAIATCDEQLAKLNNMYTISMSVLNFMTLPTGFIVVHLGCVWTSAMGSAAMFAAVLLLGFSSSDLPAWQWGYIGMAVAGPLVIFPVLSLPGRLGHYQGLLFSLIVGATDGSSIVFYVIQLAYFYTPLGYTGVFLIYATLPLAFLLASFWIYPLRRPGKMQNSLLEDAVLLPATSMDSLPRLERSYSLSRSASMHQPEPWEPTGDIVSAMEVVPEEVQNEEEVVTTKRRRLEEIGMPWVVDVADEGVKRVILSPAYVLLAVWFAVYTTNNYFYIENVNSILYWATGGDDSRASVGTAVFSILLPVTVVFTPVTSFLLDRYPVELSYVIMGLLSFVAAVLSLLPSYGLQFPAMFLMVFNRFYFNSTAPFLLSLLYGPIGMTTVYGVANFVAATANLSNYLWSYLVLRDSAAFYPVIGGLGLCCLVSSLLVALYIRRLKAQLLGENARG